MARPRGETTQPLSARTPKTGMQGMATARARARALPLGVLLVLVLCLTACAGERQPTDTYVSYAGLPRAGGGSNAGVPRGSAGNGGRSAGSAILGRCKSSHGQPPTLAAAKTTVAESKGAYIRHAALSADKYPSPEMTGAKTADKYPTPTMTGAKTADQYPAPTMTGAKTADQYPAPTMTGAKTATAGPEGAHMSPAALSEEKRRYISYAALKHDKPHGKCPLPTCP